jgi:hypothetical protein
MLRQLSIGLTALFLAAVLSAGAQAADSDPTAVAQAWLPNNAECFPHVVLTVGGKPFAGDQLYVANLASGYVRMGMLRSQPHAETDGPGTSTLYTPTAAGKAHVVAAVDDATGKPSTQFLLCFAVVNDLKNTGQQQEDGAPANFTSFSFTGTFAPASWVNSSNKAMLAKLWPLTEGFSSNIVTVDWSKTLPMSGHISFRLVMEHLPNGDWRVVKLRR